VEGVQKEVEEGWKEKKGEGYKGVRRMEVMEG